MLLPVDHGGSTLRSWFKASHGLQRHTHTLVFQTLAIIMQILLYYAPLRNQRYEMWNEKCFSAQTMWIHSKTRSSIQNVREPPPNTWRSWPPPCPASKRTFQGVGREGGLEERSIWEWIWVLSHTGVKGWSRVILGCDPYGGLTLSRVTTLIWRNTGCQLFRGAKTKNRMAEAPPQMRSAGVYKLSRNTSSINASAQLCQVSRIKDSILS